ncbi:MAG: YdcF family protein [Clostridia bacterium]|nr:YdcF family protein [Clostridia bacterium]
MNTLKTLMTLALCLALAWSAPALCEEAGSPARALIERAVVTYAAYGEVDAESIEALRELDPELGDKWAAIMDIWQTPVEVNDVLPGDLPEDDSLCLVVLGFQLNPDGTMRDELIQRLTVALKSAEKYPNAFVICTGGGTAPYAPDATEAGRMAEWLIENGLDASRVLVEDRSLTTAQNAMYSFEILAEQAPQVKQLAIISSDYHIFTGTLLFRAEAILTGSDIRVTSNASWKAPSGALSAMFQAGALIELSGDIDTAFDIYYETNDIHELPSREAADR